MTSVRLAEAAARFLATLTPTRRLESQQELNRFIRWCGVDRLLGELKPPEIARYAEEMTGPDPTKRLGPAKAFLVYAKKQAFTATNLSVHLKPKKVSLKAVHTKEQPAGVLTSQGKADLEAELEALKGRRPRIVQDLAHARADKDFRENAPLDAARDAQGQLEARIQELEGTLRASEVAETQKTSEKAALGDTVVIKDLAWGDEVHYTLVGSSEADLRKGKLSVESPTGKALLDRAEGELVEVMAPAGVQRYQIISIKH